jgi:hypothetical protein
MSGRLSAAKGKIAKAIGCSKATIERLLRSETLASDEMLKQGGALIELGIKRYSKVTSSEREKISETIGSVGGGAVGFASITAAVGSLGTVGGLSAAGVSSGLAALGAVVGGGMAAGIVVAAAIPVAAAASGYGVVKATRWAVGKHSLAKTSYEPRWETDPAGV